MSLIFLVSQGFGLQIGSDFYLLLDPGYRAQLERVASSISSIISLSGTWVADNSSTVAVPLIGTWTFNHNVSPTQYDIIDGCFRPKRFPWFLQPFPTWTSFLIVPMFSLLSSLANLQPFRSKQLPVMVLISCCSYASNKIANHYIFNRSDIVSAIGAFTVGLLGNVYSRKMGGTAFTSMVTGVLFLVPVSFSENLAGRFDLNGFGLLALVWSFLRWWNHREWQWHRYRRRNDCCNYRYHGWTVHEPSTRLHVRQPKERCSVFLLNVFLALVDCNTR